MNENLYILWLYFYIYGYILWFYGYILWFSGEFCASHDVLSV